jgi:hypothetical protein
VADAGYSNGEQASRLEAAGLIPHVPATRGINNQGGGGLLDRSIFVYPPETDSFPVPGRQDAPPQATGTHGPGRLLSG